MIMLNRLKIDDLHKLSNIPKDAFRRSRWTPPTAAIVPNFHLPMRSYEVKNRTSTDGIKALRLITAIKTSYLPDGRFDLEAYDSLVNMQIEDGADGVIVGGTTGEGQLMSWDEHIMLIGHTINCFGSAIKAIGNTGSNSTREAVHATEQGFAVGMHAALHINPYYGKTSLEGMVAEDAVRRSRWTPPTAAIVPNFHLPMRSYEVKNRTSTDGIKALRLITAIKTSYLPDGRFDLEAYDSLVNMQIEDGADGVIVGGTTGEGQLMSWDEHIMLIGHTINCFGSAIKVIGNAGSNSTREAVHATEQGFAVGMHAALHINPYYGKTSLEGMVAEDAVSISIEDLCRLSIKKEDLHLPGLIKAMKMPSSPSGRFDLKAYDSSDNRAGMLMFGLLGIQSAVESATICSLMQSNEVKNRTSMEKQVPSDHQSWSIPSRCHDVTRVAVLPRAAQIFWRPKSKFKIRTLYIFVGKLRFFMI